MFKHIAKLKVYLGRAVSYISILNFIMISATFKVSYGLDISIFLLAPVMVIIALIAGYIDYKVVLKHEIRHNNEQNNVKHQIDVIEKKIDSLVERVRSD